MDRQSRDDNEGSLADSPRRHGWFMTTALGTTSYILEASIAFTCKNKHRQRTYNATLRRFRATTVTVQKI